MGTKLKLILLLSLLLINPASAKFICGEVHSMDKITPAWYEVKTYLTTAEIHSSSCKVSPSNNRYCCDLDVIKSKTGYQWKSGDIFEARITDTTSGYFATPQNTTLTGEGYDVAPKLILRKAIRITKPNTTLTISEILAPIQTNISSHCNNITLSKQNLSFGKNNIIILATCNNVQFALNKTFFYIQNITFQKTYPRKIRAEELSTISLQASLSHKLENIQLKEYVPVSWQVSNISSNGTIEKYTSYYNVITWQVNGDGFNFNYKIKAPEIGFIPEEFSFKTQVDEHTLEENKIKVYKLIPLPPKSKTSHGGYVYTPKKLSKVSPGQALISQKEDLIAALYSTLPLQQGSFDLSSFIYDGKLDRKFYYLKSYQVQTTLNSTEKGKIIMEYSANKTFIEENDYKEIGFFEKHAGKFLRITGAVVASDRNTIHYRFESNESPSEIYILAEKNSLTILDRILNFWDSVKIW